MEGAEGNVRDNLVCQFLLSDTPANVPGWTARQMPGWHFYSHTSLPVTEVKDSNGVGIAWMLGHPLHSERSTVDGCYRLEFDASQPASINAFEHWLYEFSGRFACIVLTGDTQRFYLDAGGTLATVHEPGRRRVASTPTALHVEDLDGFSKRVATIPAVKANQFYPAALTPFDGIFRLLPNHFLDLKSFDAKRHWPITPITRVDAKQARVHAWRIADLTRQTIFQAAMDAPLSVGLSAGRDSRMIAACARPLRDRTTYFTFDYRDIGKFADLQIATRLARAARLKHRTLDLRDPSPEMKQDYLFRIGYTNHHGKACDFDDACRRQLDLRSALLIGYGGEVGRSFYYKTADAPGLLAPEDLLKRMKLELSPRNLDAIRRWRDSLPAHADPHLILDLMYIELRLGCWASPQLYGMAPFRAIICPLVSRDCFNSMLRLPVAYRTEQLLAQDVIDISWPELLDLPFQKLVGCKGWIDGCRKQLHRWWERSQHTRSA